jgi:hypothetical protein
VTGAGQDSLCSNDCAPLQPPAASFRRPANANDWAARLPAIAAAVERINAKSFTLDGEAIVVAYRSGPCPVWIKVLTPQASQRSENWNK